MTEDERRTSVQRESNETSWSRVDWMDEAEKKIIEFLDKMFAESPELDRIWFRASNITWGQLHQPTKRLRSAASTKHNRSDRNVSHVLGQKRRIGDYTVNPVNAGTAQARKRGATYVAKKKQVS